MLDKGKGKVRKAELRAEMLRRGYTYETMAAAIGLSSNTFHRKINGKNDFTLSEIQTIIKLLELDDQQLKAIFF